MTSLPSLSGYAYWLLLSQDSEAIVENRMSEFRAAFESPNFKPHLTLAGFRSNELKEVPDPAVLKELAENVSSELRPFYLAINGLDGENHPYRALYIKIEPSDILFSLRMRIMNELNLDPNIENYNPHVSLLYGFMGESERISFIQSKPLIDQDRLLATAIGLIRVNGTPEQWELVHTAEFRK